MSPAAHLPIVDVSGFRTPGERGVDEAALVRQLDNACREIGFFGVVGHGVDPTLLGELDTAARDFFALPDEVKSAISMRHAGRAWRGWFPLYGEVTSGRPDGKEGLYFGTDHPADHPRILDGTLLHGANLYPQDPPALRAAVIAWLDALRPVADTVMAAIALALGLDARWFERHLTADPTILFRVFHYPPTAATNTEWGVAEHTDYGLLTLLAQDGEGGLEVRNRDGRWLEVEPTPDVLVCNIGDMLERLTRGRYRSTPHRVRNTSDRARLSFPYFFDPSWDATVPTLPLIDEEGGEESERRWDRADPIAWEGTYGDYLSAKVARVFGDLI
ncbi:MAG: 2-oxoglutarate and iron-dependent oxygenase domain-containing protein [Acidimicrobiia bacterium]|nr:2-oxoglutarate and iron-dependent oxygenase domain-containing protein [Acidimicrobiia bacterium]